MYRFSLSCKEVGFLIYKLRNFICKNFAVFFYLWGNGGPHWEKDYNLWLQEQDAEWTTVGKKKSFVDAVRFTAKSQSVFLRLSYPKDYQLNYLPSNRKSHIRESSSVHRPVQRVLRWVIKDSEKIRESNRAVNGNAPLNLNSNSDHSFSAQLNSSKPGIEPPKAAPFIQVQASAKHINNALLGSAQNTTLLCSRCLSPGHLWKSCTNSVRCDFCHFYGHKSRSCLKKARQSRVCWAVKNQEGGGAGVSNISRTVSESSSLVPPSSATQEKTLALSSSSPAMANFAVDPRPHVPKGFSLLDQPLRPPLRQEVFVSGCFVQANEDLAIIKLSPPVHKDDFGPLASELRRFFSEVHRAHVFEVQPCALGDAFVRFGSALERERFLGPVFSFGPYAMTVIKHDEAENARTFDLDREAWVMLVGFPEDLKSTAIVAKAVSGFGILVDWHEPDNLARVVAKVYLNNEAKIPVSVKVNAGLPQRGHSWTVAVYVLKKKAVSEAPEEEAYITEGPLHPLPMQPPRWNGPSSPADTAATPVGSNADPNGNQNATAPGDNMNVDQATNVAQAAFAAPVPTQAATPSDEPSFDVIVNDEEVTDTKAAAGNKNTIAPRQLIRSVVMGGPVLGLEPRSPLLASSNKSPLQPCTLFKVLSYVNKSMPVSFLTWLNSLDINPDTFIPHFFNDFYLWAQLACLLPSQSNESPMDRKAMKELLSEDDDLMEISGTNFTSRKRRHAKLKEQLDDSFLRRSKRLSEKTAGFKDAKCAQEAGSTFSPVPLDMIPAPGSTPAPHLTQDIVQGIAEGFLQIHPSVASAALLDQDVNNDREM